MKAAKATVAPADRGPVLRRARDLKMARSLHAYVRGATDRFYGWLDTRQTAADVPVGPPIWICGDCHLGNLGPIADPAGRVEVRIRDLDQTVIGNPAVDLIRLGLSLAAVARGGDLPGVVAARMLEAMIEGYEAAMAAPDDAGRAPAMIATIRKTTLSRRWRRLARDGAGDAEPTLPIGKRYWPLAAGEGEAIAALLESPAVRERALGQIQPGGVRLVDAAYWRKGCSSLGLLRYAATVEVEGRTGDSRWALIDVKEAPSPAIPPSTDPHAMPRDGGERVAAGARALSPDLGDRMAPAHLLGRPVVVRELKPQDLKLDDEPFAHVDEAAAAARHLAWIVGRAHAAQMDAVTRNRWWAELHRHRPPGLEAPSWLWRTVVGLAADHEAGYLDHCRRYALNAG